MCQTQACRENKEGCFTAEGFLPASLLHLLSNASSLGRPTPRNVASACVVSIFWTAAKTVQNSCPVYLSSASHMSRHIFLRALFSLLCYFNLERRRSRITHLPAFLQSVSIPWVFLRDPLFQNTVALSACFRKSSWKSVWVNSVPISSFQE